MAKTILICDDSSFMRLMLKNMIAGGGYEVVGEAGNGLEALERYKELLPDIVTMDITMPDMSGIESVRAIRRLDPAAKIIMCSAMGQRAMALEAIAAGASDFLVKPFRADKVLESLRRVSAL